MKITVITTEYKIKEGTKSVWIVEDGPNKKEIDILQYERATARENVKMFKRMFGGSERATYNYTCRGYNVVKLVSKCPERKVKVVREYEFE